MCSAVGGGGSSSNKESNREQPIEKINTEFKYEVERKDDVKIFDDAKDTSTFSLKSESSTFSATTFSGGSYEEEEDTITDVEYEGGEDDQGIDADFDSCEGSDADSEDGDDDSDDGDESSEIDEDTDNDGNPDGMDDDENDDGDSRATEDESGSPKSDGNDSRADGKISAEEGKTEMNGKDVKPTESYSLANIPANLVDAYKAGHISFGGLLSPMNNPYLQKDKVEFGGILSFLNDNKNDDKKEEKWQFGGILSPLNSDFKGYQLIVREGFSTDKVDSKYKVTDQFVEKAKETVATLKEEIANQESSSGKTFDELKEEKNQKGEEIGSTNREIADLKEKISEAYQSEEWSQLQQEQNEADERYEIAVADLDERGITGAEREEELSSLKEAQEDAKNEIEAFKDENIRPFEEEIKELEDKRDALLEEKRDIAEELNEMRKEGTPDNVEDLKEAVSDLEAIIQKLEEDPSAHVDYREMGVLYDTMVEFNCIDFDKDDNFAAMFEGGADYVCASFQETRDEHNYDRSELREQIEAFNDKFDANISTAGIDRLQAFADHTKLGVDGNDLKTSFSTEREANMAIGTFNGLKDYSEDLKGFSDEYKQLLSDYQCSKPGGDTATGTDHPDVSTGTNESFDPFTTGLAL